MKVECRLKPFPFLGLLISQRKQVLHHERFNHTFTCVIHSHLLAGITPSDSAFTGFYSRFTPRVATSAHGENAVSHSPGRSEFHRYEHTVVKDQYKLDLCRSSPVYSIRFRANGSHTINAGDCGCELPLSISCSKLSLFIFLKVCIEMPQRLIVTLN